MTRRRRQEKPDMYKNSTKSGNSQTMKLSLWARIKKWFRRHIYPRRFDVTLVNARNGKMKRLDFKALDKFEDSGRFSGDCKETIVIDGQDYDHLFDDGLLARVKAFFSV